MATVGAIILAVLTAIGAIAKAAPAVAALVDRFTSMWVASRIAAMAKENRDVIRKAAVDYDQRPIEGTIGSPTAGDPSGVPGSVFVPGPPTRSVFVHLKG